MLNHSEMTCQYAKRHDERAYSRNERRISPHLCLVIWMIAPQKRDFLTFVARWLVVPALSPELLHAAFFTKLVTK